jgi:hypothetical protein
MKIYFSKKSLSHIKVWKDYIVIYLLNGESFTVIFDDRLEKREWENILSRMLLDSDGDNSIVCYDGESSKLYLKI